MEKNRENIDHLFKQELGSYTETPPAAVWEALEKRLGETRRKRAFPYMRLWYISLVSVIVLLGAAMAWYMAGSARNTVVATTNNETAKPLAAVAATAITDNNQTADKTGNKETHTKHRRPAHMAPATAANERRAITHKAIKKDNIQTNKTHDDLYADTDDDQYTVGYSSNSQKHADMNETSQPEYRMQPRSQHNIIIADTDPEQQASGHTYGSAASTTRTAPLPATMSAVHNSSNVTHTQYAATTATGERNDNRITGHRQHIHKVQTANTAATKHSDEKSIAAATPHKGGVRKDEAPTQPAQVKQATEVAVTTGSTRRHLHAKHITPASETTAVTVTKPVINHSDKTGTHPQHKAPVVAVSKPAAPAANHNTSTVAAPLPVATKSATDRHVQHSSKAAIFAAAPKPAAATNNSTTPVAVMEKKAAEKAPTNATHTYAAASTVNQTKAAAPRSTPSAVAVTHTNTPAEHAAKKSSPIATTKKALHKDAPADNKQVVKADKQITLASAPVKRSAAAARKPVSAPAPQHIAVKETQTNKQAPIKATTQQKAVAITERNTRAKGTAGKTSRNAAQATTPPALSVALHNYGSSLTRRTVEDETAIADNVKASTFSPVQPAAIDAYEQLLPSTFKPAIATKPDSVVSIAATDAVKHHLFSKRFEAGVKAGYETGFNKAGANKAVVSPYLQYNLTDRFSLMTQPSVKVSHVAARNIGNSRSYVDTSKGKVAAIDSGVIPLIITGGGIIVQGSEELRKYMYTQTYDSIVKSSAIGGTYMEFEVPLLLKYALYKHLSVYGGANFTFSKLVTTTENTYNSGPLVKNKIGVTVTPSGEPVPPPPAMGNVIQYASPLLSTYTGPAYPSSSGDLLRIGYMLGFSYEYKKRWLFDVLMQQAMVKPRYEGGYNANAPLALPYFRFTIGYKLTK